MVREVKEHGSLGALRVWGFGFMLIEISSRKAVPQVQYHTFTGRKHDIDIVASVATRNGGWCEWPVPCVCKSDAQGNELGISG